MSLQEKRDILLFLLSIYYFYPNECVLDFFIEYILLCFAGTVYTDWFHNMDILGFFQLEWVGIACDQKRYVLVLLSIYCFYTNDRVCTAFWSVYTACFCGARVYTAWFHNSHILVFFPSEGPSTTSTSSPKTERSIYWLANLSVYVNLMGICYFQNKWVYYNLKIKGLSVFKIGRVCILLSNKVVYYFFNHVRHIFT